MGVLEERDNLSVGVTNAVEGLLAMFNDFALDELDEAFLPNLSEVSVRRLELAIKLDRSDRVTGLTKVLFNLGDAFLVSTLRRETVETGSRWSHTLVVLS